MAISLVLRPRPKSPERGKSKAVRVEVLNFTNSEGCTLTHESVFLDDVPHDLGVGDHRGERLPRRLYHPKGVMVDSY